MGKQTSTSREYRRQIIYGNLMDSDSKKERISILFRDSFKTFNLFQCLKLIKASRVVFPLMLDDLFIDRWVK